MISNKEYETRLSKPFIKQIQICKIKYQNRIEICEFTIIFFNMSSRNVFLASSGYDSIIRFWDISGGHSKRTIKYEENNDAKLKMV